MVLLITAGIYAFSSFGFSAARATDATNLDRDRLVAIRDALVAFVSTNGRLPCPSLGTAPSGLPDPNTASTTCNSADGTVPWAALGLAEEEVLDASQQRISYRVFSGNTGFTQAKGLLLADCDSVRAAFPTSTPTLGVDANGLCRTDHETSPAEFLAGKGLALTDNGSGKTDVAFILIAHGSNGAGAFRKDGTRNALPNVASAEYGNTQAAGPFVVKAASSADTDKTATTYFDDAIVYMSATDLIARAKTGARDWPDPIPPTTLASATFSTAAVNAAAVASGFTPVGTSLNTSALTFNSITIVSSGAAGVEISSGSGTSGQGIGVLSGTATTGGTVSGTDVLTFGFSSAGQRLGLLMVDFGSVFGQAERAQLIFKNGAATVSTMTIQSCGTGSVLASYDINVGADFTSFSVQGLTRVGSTSNSTFRVGELKVCSASASSCATDNATVSTACP